MTDLERTLGPVAVLAVFMIVYLVQVQSIDYSGDEVQVTIADGTGCTAQKVGAGISRGLGGRSRGCGKTVFYPEVDLWQSAWGRV